MKINLSKELHNLSYWNEVAKSYFENNKSVYGLESPEYYLNRLEDYKWDYPTRVLIPKDNGKYREIFMLSDKDSFLVKVIYRILYKSFNHTFSENLFSYKENTRIYDGAREVQKHLINNEYGLKLDISNYFMSVSSDAIYKALTDLIEDKEGLKLLTDLYSLNAFYDGYSDKDKGILTNEYLGIMPGNAISAFLANYILKDLDVYMTETCKGYCRYSDDLIYFTSDDLDSYKVLKSLTQQIAEIGLEVNPSKIDRFGYKSTVIFLGLKITKTGIHMSSKTLTTIKRNIKLIINKHFKCKDDLQKTIYWINKYLYPVYITNDRLSGLIEFYNGNTTSIQDFIDIDFYLKDRLRQAYTGRNNQSNIIRCPQELLVENGYVPMKVILDLLNKDKNLYRTFMNVHQNRFKPNPSSDISESVKYEMIKDRYRNCVRKKTVSVSALDLVTRFPKIPFDIVPYVIIKGSMYKLTDLDFDISKGMLCIRRERSVVYFNHLEIFNMGVTSVNKDFITNVNIKYDSNEVIEPRDLVNIYNSLIIPDGDESISYNRTRIKESTNLLVLHEKYFNSMLHIQREIFKGHSLDYLMLLFKMCAYKFKQANPKKVQYVSYRNIVYGEYICLSNLAKELPSPCIFF